MLKNHIEKLFVEHFDSVYRYVYFRIRSVAETEDIVSSCFEKIVKQYSTYSKKDGASVRSWIFTIVRNTIIDFYRTRKEYISIDEVQEASTQKSMMDTIDASLELQKVFARIDALPPRQKEMMLLKYQVGLSNKEIAAVLKINQRSVSASLSKSIQLLRTALTRPL